MAALGPGLSLGPVQSQWQRVVFIDDIDAKVGGGPQLGLDKDSGFAPAMELSLQILDPVVVGLLRQL